jgi:hypothetical protein
LLIFSYIKLIPIRPWDDNFHTSVWFFNIKGIDDEDIISTAIKEYNEYMEIVKMKTWVKLSRQNFKKNSCQFFKLKEVNNMIRKIEHPLLTQLYTSLLNGEYSKAIEIIKNCQVKGLLDYYIKTLPYQIIWKKLNLLDDLVDKYIEDLNYEIKLIKKTNRTTMEIDSENFISIIQTNYNNEESVSLDNMSLTFLDDLGSPNLDDNLGYSTIGLNNDNLIMNYPPSRGGHCMALDEDNGIVYLLGGWTGRDDLNDFWSFNINKCEWTLISANTLEQGGPSQSSCGKMVYDNVYKRLLLFGKFGSSITIDIDDHLYEYSLFTNKWRKFRYLKEKVNGNIVEGTGPGQVFDLQMVMDTYLQHIYMFGGFKVPGTENGIITLI